LSHKEKLVSLLEKMKFLIDSEKRRRSAADNCGKKEQKAFFVLTALCRREKTPMHSAG